MFKKEVTIFFMSIGEINPGRTPQPGIERRDGNAFDKTRAWVDIFSAGIRLLMDDRPDLSQSLHVGSTTVALSETVVNGQPQNGSETGGLDQKVQDARTIVTFLANQVGLRTEPMENPTKQ